MYSDKPTTPEGLHELEYARHLLEEVLGWPAKGNIELVADCIRAISLSRKLTPVKAHAYLERAIRLAKEQRIPVNKFFFQDGIYTEVRPERASVEVPPGSCERCGGEGLLLQDSTVPGPRLVECPDCNGHTANLQVGHDNHRPETPAPEHA